jgi:phosphatidate cytidylyltransferase
MQQVTAERLWGFRHAFDHPVTDDIVVGIAVVLATAMTVIAVLGRSGLIGAALRRELWLRTWSWVVIVLIMLVPILLGALWTIVLVCCLGLACYSEYARATGLFRERTISAFVVLGILVLTFAELDHWYGFFVALFPLTVGFIAVSSIPGDRPQGYIQRVALGVFGFLLFGSALGHLGYIANDWNYRPILLMILSAVALNDVAAFVVGKSLGGPKLLRRTSPNKTISGSIGGLAVTAAFVFVISGPVFAGTGLAGPWHRLGLGLIIGVAGQLGDLMLSSIKRDLGIKDTGAVIPGHGGILDRANSLLLVAPSVFHYVGYFVGFGMDQPTRIFSGG